MRIDLFDGNTMIVNQKFQCDCGLASADPPSISTVCNGFAGDMKCSSSFKLDGYLGYCIVCTIHFIVVGNSQTLHSCSISQQRLHDGQYLDLSEMV
jgi:hypothetical protein